MKRMELTAKAAADLVSGRLEAREDLLIRGIQALDKAGPDEISFAVGPKYRDLVDACRAGVIILPENWPFEVKKPAIFVKDPYLAYARLAETFTRRPFEAAGISPAATMGHGCRIPEKVSIHAGTFIGDASTIGARTTIYPGAVVGRGVEIGEDCVIYPNVVIYDGCRIGNRVVVHAGTVIGSDGFGYARDGEAYVKIPQVGIVVIEDDVEIGANVTIDRAALGETRIGHGTKIDNLVQIAHNVVIGPHSVLVGQVGVAGSARIGRGVVVGGQAGIVGHVTVGDKVMIGAQAGIAGNVRPGEVVSGTPAMPHSLWRKVGVALKRLPAIIREVRDLKNRVTQLEKDST